MKILVDIELKGDHVLQYLSLVNHLDELMKEIWEKRGGNNEYTVDFFEKKYGVSVKTAINCGE